MIYESHPLPSLDLSPLPEGFRKQVERLIRSWEPEPTVKVLILSVSDAWRASTAKQRQQVEPALNLVLGKILTVDMHPEPRSFYIGMIAARMTDFDAVFVRHDEIDLAHLLQGVVEGGGLHASEPFEEILRDYVETLG